jgi:diguanylate cyclase (GGDEF)-like protein
MSILVPASPASHALSDWFLGKDEHLRRLIKRALPGFLVYAAMNVLRVVGWALGAIPGEMVVIVAVFDVLGMSTFYTLQRSGYALRLKDPGMTLAQILFALSSIILCYALIEITRGAALQLICLTLVFAMYRLSPRQIFLSGLASVVMLVGTLMALWKLQPQNINMTQQVFNIALAAFIIPVLSLVGQQVGAMRRKQIQQGRDLTEALKRLEELAMRDALTGLLNRRCVLEMLGTELKRSQRTGQRFCLAMLDIDFFKRVNDTHGHAAGDAVLVGLAQDAGLALRKTDVMARWGGEEFLLLLPQTATEFAKIPLQRLAQLLAEHDWQGVLPATERVTVSIGLAESDPDETLDELIGRADAALYEAKAGGRNRICVAAARSGAAAKDGEA